MIEDISQAEKVYVQVAEVIQWCMQPSPESRPTARRVFELLHDLAQQGPPETNSEAAADA